MQMTRSHGLFCRIISILVESGRGGVGNAMVI